MIDTALAPHRFTLASIAAGGSDRDDVEEFFTDAALLPTRSIRDLVDALDGTPWHGGEVALPHTYSDPVFIRLEGIARRVVRECRE